MPSKRLVRNLEAAESQSSRIPFSQGPTADFRLPAMHPPRIGTSFLSKPDLWPTPGRSLVKVEDRLKCRVAGFYRGQTLSSRLIGFPLPFLHYGKHPDFSGFHRAGGIISCLRDVRSKEFFPDRRYAKSTRSHQ